MRAASTLALTLLIVWQLGARAAELPYELRQQQDRYSALSRALESAQEAIPVLLRYPSGLRTVLVHNRQVAQRLKPMYGRAELANWKRWLEAERTTRIPVSERGRVQAADRNTQGPDDTHYDAVWVRDSAWAYFALSVEPTRRLDAGRVVRELLRYFATPAQLGRFEAAIADPTRLHLPNGEGAMNAVHIRFDGKSPTFDDVQVQGAPEVWNHKQNDALGLFLLALMDACDRNLVDPSDFTPAEWQALSDFVPYFKAIRFDTFEDSGAWEEIERLNTSSVGIVTRALERIQHGFADRPTPLFTAWRTHLKDEPAAIAHAYDPSVLDHLVERGYVRVQSQLPLGESPAYPVGSLKYRTADAALLNLIVPAGLEELSMAEKRRILTHVGTLVGEVGIKRYLSDSYQAGNYWFKAMFAAPGLTATGNASDDWAFKKRQAAFIANSEAQWFFDTWVSTCYSTLYQESHDPKDREQAFYFLNRGLAQITADPAGLGADGLLSQADQLPESYNTIVLKSGARHLVPSPIVPLNWAKATMILAIDALAKAD